MKKTSERNRETSMTDVWATGRNRLALSGVISLSETNNTGVGNRTGKDLARYRTIWTIASRGVRRMKFDAVMALRHFAGGFQFWMTVMGEEAS